MFYIQNKTRTLDLIEFSTIDSCYPVRLLIGSLISDEV